MRYLKGVNSALASTLTVTCGVLGLLITVIMFAQVLVRYLGGQPLSWSEEIIRYFFVWAGFLGAALAQRLGSHVVFELFENAAGTAFTALRYLASAAYAVFLVVVVIAGYRLAVAGFGVRSVAMNMPMAYVYLSVPISAVMMLMFLIEETFSRKAATDE
jgi:TRAP-type transport system small permease protein